jgi:hypothetical protein
MREIITDQYSPGTIILFSIQQNYELSIFSFEQFCCICLIYVSLKLSNDLKRKNLYFGALNKNEESSDNLCICIGFGLLLMRPITF